jgi:hypothetical protein
MPTEPMARRIELWLIDRLVPFARNPRTHSDAQVAQIAASIAEFGFNNPILVDTNAGIIAGHGRLLAARKLGLTEVPVIVLDHLTETQKRAYIIADNRLALNAGWDEDLLRIELAALRDEEFNLDLIGFEDQELAQLLAAQDATEGLTDEDAVPELPTIPYRRPAIFGSSAITSYSWGTRPNAPTSRKLMAGDAADRFHRSAVQRGLPKLHRRKAENRGRSDVARSIPRVPRGNFPLVPFNRETRRLALGVPFVFVAARIPKRSGSGRPRGSQPDYLGQEHVRMGLRAIQVSARADFLLPRRRTEGCLVRRQNTIDALAGKKARGKPTAPHGQTG